MNLLFFFKFFKFAVVGFSGLTVDFCITYFCKEFLRINRYIANSIGFSCAASSNYFLNRVWTFGNTDPHIAKQYLFFFTIALAGLAFNNLIIWLITEKLSVDFRKTRNFFEKQFPENKIDTEKINFYCAKLIAILCVVLWNFSMNYIFTF